MISFSACLSVLLIFLTPQARQLALKYIGRLYHWIWEVFTMTKTYYIHPHNLKSECVFALAAMDCLQAAIPPIAFSLFYDQAIYILKFQEALEQTLVYYPLLAGRLHRSTNPKQAPFQVKVHPVQGGALFATTKIKKPYTTKEDRRWFPIFTGAPWPSPHEPHFTYGPLLKIKHTYVASTNSSVISFGFCHAVMDATTVGAFLETLKAHYNSVETTPSAAVIPQMSLERVIPTLTEGAAEPLDRFTTATLIKAVPKVIKASTGMKHVNLTVQKMELNRLKREFLDALDGELEWVSTYEMLGVLLLRAFYMASREKLVATTKAEFLECRCIVDPRGRNANPYVNATHQGNVGEMPSIRLSYENLQPQDQQSSWQKVCLQDFHNQLRAALKDPEQMTNILRRAQASYDQGYLHTTEGRTLSSKIFARNITEDNVCSYNSWLHMDWFDMATFGDAKPLHFQVTKGLSCQDMFWVFPRTQNEVTIRTTLPPAKAKRFLQELRAMNVAFEVQ